MIKFILTKDGEIIDCLFDKELDRLSHDYTCKVLGIDGDKINKYSTGAWSNLYGVQGLMQVAEEPFIPTMRMVDSIQNHITKIEKHKKVEMKVTLRDCKRVNINDYLKDPVKSICDRMELPREYQNKEKLVDLIERLNGMRGTNIYFTHNGQAEPYYDAEERHVSKRHKWWQVVFRPRGYSNSASCGCGLVEEYEDILLDTFCTFIFIECEKPHIQSMKINWIKEDLHKLVEYGLTLFTKYAIIKV